MDYRLPVPSPTLGAVVTTLLLDVDGVVQTRRPEFVAEMDRDFRQVEVTRTKIGWGLTLDSTKGIFRLESDMYDRVLELTAVIQHGAFDWLDAPIERVGAKFAPLAFAPGMEQWVVPHADDVLAAIRRTVARS